MELADKSEAGGNRFWHVFDPYDATITVEIRIISRACQSGQYLLHE